MMHGQKTLSYSS